MYTRNGNVTTPRRVVVEKKSTFSDLWGVWLVAGAIVAGIIILKVLGV